jgi:hypothetical protein
VVIHSTGCLFCVRNEGKFLSIPTDPKKVRKPITITVNIINDTCSSTNETNPSLSLPHACCCLPIDTVSVDSEI